ncbi:aldo/keto reductase [Jeotgalibacillus soli]|uniref:NADP-dependent oxidoreductase domain-containing protein n=1 Tax=Jeotgalibacillus soli TaxID=889306 RepID=A0A0C2RHE8_9BACL|nr:aldo/keto reductase [Jeotgalibacillus soli]KIL49585.1 hypothetical protein KP78_10530 [Jeotgalibacillus soli]
MVNVKKRTLGQTSLKLSPLGLGCWQFSNGKGLVGGYWTAMDESVIKEIVQTSLDGGINWFDTAEVYGKGQSEKNLAHTLDQLAISPEDARIATKWWPLFRSASSITNTIEERMESLNQRPIDLYQVHQPFSISSVKKEMDNMVKLVEKKAIAHIGVSNFNAKAMTQAHTRLQEYGLHLASNQVKYSLLDRRIEKNGVVDAAKKLGISLIAYSPLEQGILSGKFHKNPSLIQQASGVRKYLGKFQEKGLAKSYPLIEKLEELAEKYEASASQVALNWLIHYHGDTIFAIPGASKSQHAKENIGAMTFKLTREELEEVSRISWEIVG